MQTGEKIFGREAERHLLTEAKAETKTRGQAHGRLQLILIPEIATGVGIVGLGNWILLPGHGLEVGRDA